LPKVLWLPFLGHGVYTENRLTKFRAVYTVMVNLTGLLRRWATCGFSGRRAANRSVMPSGIPVR